MENAIQHTLNMTDRGALSMSGVSDVDSFNEQEILAITSSGELTVKGEALHIEELNTDTGELRVSGRINSLSYSDSVTASSILKRLFGG